MKYETICFDVSDDGVSHVRLNLPERHNAMSATMIAELTNVASVIQASNDIRVVVLEANGKSFCAGGDLSWMKAQMSASREERIAEAEKLANMLSALNTIPVPLVAKVHGNAFGGGVGLLSVCDIAYCSKNVKIALTEVKLGLIPATISPYVVAKIGESNARSIGLTAKIVDAVHAEKIGLITEVVDDLDAAISTEITSILKVAPGAVGATKSLFRSLGPRIDKDVIDESIKRLAEVWEQPEAHEGVSAFFEKRDPNWIK